MKKSPRRGYANRRNGLLSCGPSSEEGKAKSSRNALKHGLTARHLLLQGENPLEYRNHVQALHDDFSPKGALENGLVGRIADLSWRLRRVPRFEAALLTSIRDEDSVDAGSNRRGKDGKNAARLRSPKVLQHGFRR